jgi:hypothetical protein
LCVAARDASRSCGLPRSRRRLLTRAREAHAYPREPRLLTFPGISEQRYAHENDARGTPACDTYVSFDRMRGARCRIGGMLNPLEQGT